jgi:hypothetical protein
MGVGSWSSTLREVQSFTVLQNDILINIFGLGKKPITGDGKR